MALMRVDVSIDELVLFDVDPRDRYRIADAVERELAARVTASHARGLAARGASLGRLRGSAVARGLPAASSGDSLGRSIGRSVAGAIEQGAIGRDGGRP